MGNGAERKIGPRYGNDSSRSLSTTAAMQLTHHCSVAAIGPSSRVAAMRADGAADGARPFFTFPHGRAETLSQTLSSATNQPSATRPPDTSADVERNEHASAQVDTATPERKALGSQHSANCRPGALGLRPTHDSKVGAKRRCKRINETLYASKLNTGHAGQTLRNVTLNSAA